MIDECSRKVLSTLLYKLLALVVTQRLMSKILTREEFSKMRAKPTQLVGVVVARIYAAVTTQIGQGSNARGPRSAEIDKSDAPGPQHE